MSHLVQSLLFQIEALGLPAPILEFRLFKGRRWRWDMCWEKAKLLVEVQGGIWTRGAHGRGSGIRRDYEKNNAATLAGWKVLQFGVNEIEDGTAAETIAKALELAERES